MKKLFFIALAILLMASVSYAATVGLAVDPKNNREVWTTTVYVDETSSTTVDAGNVVCWDVDDSSGDDKNWVENCDSETGLVAGVVWPADISGGSIGLIAIKGSVPVDVPSTGYGSVIAANAILCSSSTAGVAAPCTTLDREAYGFGFAVGDSSGGVVQAYINP